MLLKPLPQSGDLPKVFQAFKLSSKRIPKFRCHAGRTWDSSNLYINGNRFELWSDTTWGNAGYFCYNGNWYRVSFVQTINGKQETLLEYEQHYNIYTEMVIRKGGAYVRSEGDK